MHLLLLFLLPVFDMSANRVLDIYAKNKSDITYRQQMKVFEADPKGLKDRDLIVREHFGASGYKITLTGKDGGVKYSSKSVLMLKKLYSIIDVMPMRRDEMSH